MLVEIAISPIPLEVPLDPIWLTLPQINGASVCVEGERRWGDYGLCGRDRPDAELRRFCRARPTRAFATARPREGGIACQARPLRIFAGPTIAMIVYRYY